MFDPQQVLPAVIRSVERGDYVAAAAILAAVLFIAVLSLSIAILRNGRLKLSANAGIDFRLGQTDGDADKKRGRRKVGD
jgi:hypothetical protein